MITMLLGGLWHGANWTFVFWGGLHGLYLVGQRLLSPLDLKTRLKLPPLIFDGLALTVVFSLTCFAWIFFRSQSFSEALTVLQGIFAFDDLSFEEVKYKFLVIKGFLLIGLLVTGELVAGYLPIIPQVIIRRPALRAVAFASIIWIIAALGTFDGNQFIYFQF
jgi:D-alanyl-lipoteichoic acid acyltransferase DltB (MBOAT superfamily)